MKNTRARVYRAITLALLALAPHSLYAAPNIELIFTGGSGAKTSSTPNPPMILVLSFGAIEPLPLKPGSHIVDTNNTYVGDGDFVPLGTKIIAGATFYAKLDHTPAATVRISGRLDTQTIAKTVNVPAASFGTQYPVDLGTLTINHTGHVQLSLHADAGSIGTADYKADLTVGPAKVTLTTAPSGPTSLPTTKLTLTSTPGPTTVTGGFTTAPSFGFVSLKATMPNLQYQTVSAATTALKNAGFTATPSVTYQAALGMGARTRVGQVVSQSPAAGSSVAAGTAITLTVLR